MDVFVTGFAAGLGLIVAIGAQNAWVLRQGLRRAHMGWVVGICIASDLVLMAAGTLGIGAIVDRAAWVLTVLTWAGVAYLCWFAFTSFRSALRPDAEGLRAQGAAGPGLGAVVGATLAVTWLNPHVYLDTMVFLGSLANQYGGLRWVFTAGSMTGSVCWFSALGFGARALSGPMSSPRVWRGLDLVIGVVMLALAVRLALGAI
ncbi:Lysine-type exporter protein (LYSE/YGGA) [Propionibacterium ruminifibrarum]|uniref:Lysine-type exporter protein (LYSE/YGGA) n=1 Tax=Propionibacterium ruminifibrarum TaxID=1962131 RepID=A0A375I076_9ACTN|nr:LysE/ArgO family amino acid transporter [Propionibacterium ruminifibrarum]SPF68209.1 Lysine-type exporter protein (LYSE/YGGA) [Propionibacterium ruminifibrarum]